MLLTPSLLRSVAAAVGGLDTCVALGKQWAQVAEGQRLLYGTQEGQRAYAGTEVCWTVAAAVVVDASWVVDCRQTCDETSSQS